MHCREGEKKKEYRVRDTISFPMKNNKKKWICWESEERDTVEDIEH